MSALRFCKLDEDLYINVDDIRSITIGIAKLNDKFIEQGTMITFKGGETATLKNHTPSEVIGFIRTQTQDIFSIS